MTVQLSSAMTVLNVVVIGVLLFILEIFPLSVAYCWHQLCVEIRQTWQYLLKFLRKAVSVSLRQRNMWGDSNVILFKIATAAMLEACMYYVVACSVTS